MYASNKLDFYLVQGIVFQFEDRNRNLFNFRF